MNILKGKRLLILGGSAAMRDVIIRAKQKGIYTVVTDYYRNSPGKQIADKSYDVSTMDLDLLKQIIKKEKIDGVFTGFSDANLKPCYFLAKEFNFPFYANLDQIEQTTNKINFKKVCRECGIPVVEEYFLDSSFNREDLNKIIYPVIVKPADSYASKGITICDNELKLINAYKDALRYSNTQTVIIERYIEGWDDSCMYLTIQNGNVTLSAMTDRDMNFLRTGRAQQPNALFFPSNHIEAYYEKLHTRICEMIKYLNIKNGTMFIQFFFKDNEFLIFETGYRLCGASEYIIVSSENNINTVDMHLNYALTGQFDGWNSLKYDNAKFKNKYVILVILLRPGTIKIIKGLSSIKDNEEVINILQFLDVGDTVSDSEQGSLDQTFARIYIKSKSTKRLHETIKFIQNTLSVINGEKGEMIISGIDITKE